MINRLLKLKSIQGKDEKWLPQEELTSTPSSICTFLRAEHWEARSLPLPSSCLQRSEERAPHPLAAEGILGNARSIWDRMARRPSAGRGRVSPMATSCSHQSPAPATPSSTHSKEQHLFYGQYTSFIYYPFVSFS